MSRSATLNQAVRACERVGHIRCQNTKTVTLETRNRETRYTPVGAGIRIDDSSGTSEILITQIQNCEHNRNTMKRKALCADSMPGKRLKHYQNLAELSLIGELRVAAISINHLEVGSCNAVNSDQMMI